MALWGWFPLTSRWSETLRSSGVTSQKYKNSLSGTAQFLCSDSAGRLLVHLSVYLRWGLFLAECQWMCWELGRCVFLVFLCNGLKAVVPAFAPALGLLIPISWFIWASSANVSRVLESCSAPLLEIQGTVFFSSVCAPQTKVVSGSSGMASAAQWVTWFSLFCDLQLRTICILFNQPFSQGLSVAFNSHLFSCSMFLKSTNTYPPP